MLRYYITDRHQLGGTGALLARIEHQLREWVDFIQIREKDLAARELFELVHTVMEMENPGNTKILVNTRLDIALAAGAHGVHLPGDSIAPVRHRPFVPERFLIGVSCHSTEEVSRADEEDADFAVFGPVYDPLSKAAAGPAVGIEGLRQACASARIPVFALGGITWDHAPECVAAGAAGLAGISLFQKDFDD